MENCKYEAGFLHPGTVLRLIKLWPYARKQGHEIGELWRVGYYSPQDGVDVVWLVDDNGAYKWSVDNEFVAQKFYVVTPSDNPDVFGEAGPALGKRKRSGSADES